MFNKKNNVVTLFQAQSIVKKSLFTKITSTSTYQVINPVEVSKCYNINISIKLL